MRLSASRIRSLLSGFFWPGGCRVCGAPAEGLLCAECLRLGRLESRAAPASGEPGLEVVSWGKASGPWKKIVHGFKYRGQFRWPGLMARELGEEPPFAGIDYSRAVWVPVPVHGSRRRTRGYNQAELLARAFAARWGGRVETGWLRRLRASVSQTRLGAAQRRANVDSEFGVPASRGPFPEGCTPILVDDVYTTGSTLKNCSEALGRAGLTVRRAVTLLRAELTSDDFEAEMAEAALEGRL